MSKKLNVLIDTTPIGNGHAIRGIGMYTKQLATALLKSTVVNVFTSPTEVEDKKVDVIHYPYFDLFKPSLKIKSKVATVVTIHDVIPLIFPKFYRPGVKGRLNFIRQKQALKKVDAIITDSYASKKDIEKHLGVDPEKIEVVYLAANPDLSVPSQKRQQELVKSLNLPKKYVLYVGDINYNKNIPQLIKTARYLPKDVHLVCVGRNFKDQEIPEWQWIETQVAMSNVQERVHFVTDIANDQPELMASVYAQALVYIQPSLYEGFGLPVLEAMSTKTPVVSSKNSSLEEVGSDKVIYARSETAEDFAAAIKEVLGWHKNVRGKFVNKAFKWSQNFSWSKTARQTSQIYRKVVQK